MAHAAQSRAYLVAVRLLATDEGFRERFSADPEAALRERSLELTEEDLDILGRMAQPNGDELPTLVNSMGGGGGGWGRFAYEEMKPLTSAS